jgi:hypothetical protein
MAQGRKTGGRVAGTPNRRTTELVERLAALGCDPVEGMARIAMDLSNPPELRGRMYAELAGYVYPKRRAVEVKADEGPRVTFFIDTDPEAPGMKLVR